MKRYISLFLAILTLFSFLSISVCAQVIVSTDESTEVTSQVVFEEHPNKQYTPIYWAIGILAILIIIALCFVVASKIR